MGGVTSTDTRTFLPQGYVPKGREYTELMATLETGERHQGLLDELLAEIADSGSAVDRELVTRAFRYAASAHEGQQRRSGSAFIEHPVGVAKICAQLRLDEQTIAAALLHDVVEDTESDIDDVRAEFGDEVAKLVEGVTKLTRIQFQSREQAEAENYRKMVVAMSEDVRVILIKLADRLHNLRTIEYLGKQTQIGKATSPRRPTCFGASSRRSTFPSTSRDGRSTSTRSTTRWRSGAGSST